MEIFVVDAIDILKQAFFFSVPCLLKLLRELAQAGERTAYQKRYVHTLLQIDSTLFYLVSFVYLLMAP